MRPSPISMSMQFAFSKQFQLSQGPNRDKWALKATAYCWLERSCNKTRRRLIRLLVCRVA